jgi:hypothetical protein
MIKTTGILLTLLFVSLGRISAQETFEDAYSDFKQKAKADYEDFRKKANKEYADWMRKAWEWHKKIEPMPMPKDEMLPPIIYKQGKGKKEPKPLPHEEITPQPEPQPQPKPVAPIREDDGDYKIVKFEFYGTSGEVRLPKDGSFKIKGKDEKAYAEAWEELASGRYDNLIRDCLVLRMEHQLCDWAYLMMLGFMSEEVCGKGTAESVMMHGFVLCQSGYKIRFGFTKESELILLFKSDHLIYDLDGIEMEDGLFYLLQPLKGDGLNICDVSYPEEKPLSLWISQEQLFSESLSEERLLIQADSARTIRVQTNKNWIAFCNSYPTSMIGEDIVSRWAMYANTPMSKRLKSKLYPQLQDAIKMYEITDAVNAANWLLYWVQTAFVYEYDDKVWGDDRAFFAEETLYYPYCDCEDRSILYSRLIRDLFGLDVILVFYPGHLATAVAFNSPVDGDYIELNGKRFVICDPTYIGAPIGETMPDMDNKTAKVILLKSRIN